MVRVIGGSSYRDYTVLSFASRLLLVIPRKTPKLYKGFKVILEDGMPEKIERGRFKGFKDCR